MKTNRPTIVLVLALLAGVMTTALTARWLQAQTADHSPLVVANVDVPLGTPLEAAMLTTVAWPPNARPHGAVQDPGALIGRVTRTSLSRHEPVLEAKLAAVGSRGGLSAAISPGKRAITVKVNEVVGVAGFALPGSVVDVMVHTQTDDIRNKPSAALSKIVLERILVLAVAQDASRDANAPRVANAVTLEVTPEEAERMDLARSVGTLSLVLRNPSDVAQTRTEGARKNDLLALTQTDEPAAPAVVNSKPAAQTTSPARANRAGPAPAAPKPPPADAIAEGVNPGDQRTEVIRGLNRSTWTW